MTTSGKILLVEDEPNFGSVLKNYLELAGYEVDLCENGYVGLSHFRREKFDICILDVMMPEKDGFELAEDIRERDAHVPLIFLTARNMKEDQIKGFQIGANDYLCKPFDSELLLWKVKALLRGGTNEKVAEKAPPSEFELGSFHYDTTRRRLQHGDNEVRLTPKEHELFVLLNQYLGGVTSRSEALNKIWGEENYFTKRSMDVYIARLRKHLHEDPRIQIENIHSEGYRLFLSDDI
ncbi:response regulator transcription factor [Sanyastnella coralliicola]|uniref:response regulator transcription factor n=1 Tax=Sanyastnella coralliicola TaxID=3069118 RepID=UPI0027B89ADF|nr:response regulator transcription factor [Longitalea sp. SCSIO 12813]